MRKLLLAAALALAAPALAQTATTATPAAPPAEQVKRAYDLASVDLQSAKLHLTGLNDLAANPNTWDKQSSTQLFNDAQREVTQAQEGVRSLQGLASSNASAASGLQQAMDRLNDAQGQLRTFAASVNNSTGDAASRQASVKSLYSAVSGAEQGLNSAAGQLQVPTTLSAPTP